MPSRTTLMHGNILSHICFQDGDEQIIAGICVKLESTQVKWNLLCEWYAPLIIQQRRRRKNKKNSAWRRNVSAKLRFFFGTPHHPIHTACRHFGWVWQEQQTNINLWWNEQACPIRSTDIFGIFLASQDAIEVMCVTYWVSQRLHWLDWCDPGERWYL